MFIHEYRTQWPIVVMYRVLSVHPSGYYAWLRRHASASSAEEQALLLAMREIHMELKQTVGSRRMVRELASRQYAAKGNRNFITRYCKAEQSMGCKGNC